MYYYYSPVGHPQVNYVPVCAVCLRVINPSRVTACGNGHRGCRDCFLPYGQCPVCWAYFIPDGEQDLWKPHRPCNYEGCGALVDPRFLSEHLKTCPGRRYTCVMQGCPERMAFSGIANHYKSQHRIAQIILNNDLSQDVQKVNLFVRPGLIACFSDEQVIYYLHCELSDKTFQFFLTYETSSNVPIRAKVRLMLRHLKTNKLVFVTRDIIAYHEKRETISQIQFESGKLISIEVFHEKHYTNSSRCFAIDLNVL